MQKLQSTSRVYLQASLLAVVSLPAHGYHYLLASLALFSTPLAGLLMMPLAGLPNSPLASDGPALPDVAPLSPGFWHAVMQSANVKPSTIATASLELAFIACTPSIEGWVPIVRERNPHAHLSFQSAVTHADQAWEQQLLKGSCGLT
jgi:hypothetical protein